MENMLRGCHSYVHKHPEREVIIQSCKADNQTISNCQQQRQDSADLQAAL